MISKASFNRDTAKQWLAKAGEYLTLFFINLKFQTRNFLDFLQIIYYYYFNLNFLKIDSYLTLSYLFSNPFTISKRFLLSKGEDEVYAYGETPLTTLEQITKTCRLSAKDRVFELGCGRGRTCFWLSQFVGCSVVGIDFVPEFIERAQKVKERFNVKNVNFRLEDMLQSDLRGATVIYLYGTCLDTQSIRSLANLFGELPKGTKIITVSYSLCDYAPPHTFEVMNRFSARFGWGMADVYLQIKK